ncbi:MAG: hypothetical protein KGH77_06240 [Candidatus Micrarchaeota archaeon]|nr:hypothetical protein [Candidatus Micrarchaeota archaeon]
MLTAVPALSQANSPMGHGNMWINITGQSNLSISLYVSFVANISNTTAPRHYYPIRLSQSQFTAQTALHVASFVTSPLRAGLYATSSSSLASQGINVTFSPDNGTTPFNANVSLSINPATSSGLYNVTIYAREANNYTSGIVLHLKVSNPTNTTFLQSHFSRVIGPQNTSTTTSPSTATTTEQQPKQQGASGSEYLYVAVIALAIIIIATVLLGRRK